MAEGFDARFRRYMREAGWRYEIASNGFLKGDMWVSHAQAVEAFDAAEKREGQIITPASREIAEVVAKAANEGKA